MTEPGTATLSRRRQGTAPSVQEALGTIRGSLPRRAVIWALIAFVGVWAPYVLPLYPLQLAVQGVTLGLLGLSVGWLRRQTGMLSFGHAMFYGFTGYAVGVLVVHVGLTTTPALLLGIAAGTVLALVVGLLIMRAGGVAFSMLTLATGMLIWVAVTQKRSITNGFDGLPVNFTGALLGRDPNDFTNPVVAWPLIWVVLMVAVAAFWLISRSVFGRHLAALRENEERTRFTGRRTYLPKVLAFTLTGLLGSIAGAVAVLNIGYISPESLFWSMSGQALIVAVIGGVGSVWGPPAGAIAYVFLQAWLSDSPYYQLIIGLILMVVVVATPGGGAELVTRAFRALARRTKGRSHA
ncbi:branched-chain amino acid ABC transporter permease [Georgenia ruanii]|uniref:branched-chain amino acid ABC transporter permease n=1 Tax=Georgenia ruanii TaxID=348442 RepID=UPI00186B4629|nr:branched-chain amino acid ABC transporter permease [Georgenia ruanii]